jgi:cardiolipin synthase
MDLGVTLHLFETDIIHAKTMTVDGRVAFLGSSNFDIRSFALNFELNMALYGEAETARVVTAQERYLAQSRRLDERAWRQRPLWRQTVEGVAKLLSPIL